MSCRLSPSRVRRTSPQLYEACLASTCDANMLRLFEIQQKAFEPCFTGLDVVGRAKKLD